MTAREIPDFTGELIAPADERYDEARAVWNAAIDRYPALIARARRTADVAAVIRYAQDNGMPLSVRGGGHSAAGLAVADGALMLDLSPMKAVAVDPAAGVAVAAPGLTWEELDAATQEHGLATTGGVVGSTGIAGLTLGGGIGWLDRLAGLTCDNLIEAEVVTADGRIITASGTRHPDLFWALRGGGNFGVVTSFSYRLHPVTTAYGGLLGYTFDRAAEVLRAYARASEDAPARLALYAALTTAPPLPFIPQNLHGQPLAGLLPVCFGTAGDHPERTVAALRALLPPPAFDATGPMSYRQVQQVSEGPGVPGMHHYYTAEWLDALDDKAIGALVNAAERATSPRSIIVVKRMGHATAEVPADGTAFWYRQAAHNLDIHAQWAPGGDPAAHRAWAHDARQAVRHASAGGGYVNFLSGDHGADRVRAAYGGNYRRLTEIKAVYDPGNSFRLNHNIPPAGEGMPDGKVPDGKVPDGKVPDGDRRSPAAHAIQRSGPPGAGS